MSGDLIRSKVFAIETVTNSIEERIEFGEELLRRQPAPSRVPKPLVAHGADTALHLCRIRNAGERGRNHVAVLEAGEEVRPFFGIVAEPMQQLGESPLVRINTAAPLDGLEFLSVRQRGDLLRFFLGAVVAP